MFTETIMPVIQEVGSTLGSIILVIIGAFCVYGFKLLMKKFGIELTATQYNESIAIITEIVKAFYQKYTKTIKDNSPDDKLTDYQASLIKSKVIDAVKVALTADQVQLLLKKYNAIEITEVLDNLIESVLLDVKDIYDDIDNKSNNYVEINTTDGMISASMPLSAKYDENDSIDQAKMETCNANCNKCPFKNDCVYSRIDK